MAYKALYRKWRPLTFGDVIGQTHITKTLKNEIAENRLAHAYLFTGTRGTGKTSTAKILSRAINCEHPVDSNPCNECEICKGILNETVMDIIEIDAASNTGVDQYPLNYRTGAVHPHCGKIQSLHHRRGAYAFTGRVQRTFENA